MEPTPFDEAVRKALGDDAVPPDEDGEGDVGDERDEGDGGGGASGADGTVPDDRAKVP